MVDALGLTICVVGTGGTTTEVVAADCPDNDDSHGLGGGGMLVSLVKKKISFVIKIVDDQTKRMLLNQCT